MKASVMKWSSGYVNVSELSQSSQFQLLCLTRRTSSGNRLSRKASFLPRVRPWVHLTSYKAKVSHSNTILTRSGKSSGQASNFRVLSNQREWLKWAIRALLTNENASLRGTLDINLSFLAQPNGRSRRTWETSAGIVDSTSWLCFCGRFALASSPKSVTQ